MRQFGGRIALEVVGTRASAIPARRSGNCG
jgi:hypothetical protein